MAVPIPEGADAGPGTEAPGPGVVGADSGSFDEATTRQTVGFLVDQYGTFKTDTVRDGVFAATADKALADDYAGRAQLSDAKKKVAVDSAVEVCRKNGVTMSPEITLAVLVANEYREFRALRADIRRLAAARAAAGVAAASAAAPAA